MILEATVLRLLDSSFTTEFMQAIVLFYLLGPILLALYNDVW